MSGDEYPGGTGAAKSRSRGSVRNKDRLAAFVTEAEKGSGDWGTASPHLLQAVIVAITSRGGAVLFGLGRDNGAHNLTMMLDGKKKTLWFNGDASLDEELERVADTFLAME